MAYETITYDTILNRMIDRVIEKYPDLDFREGSIMYNALAPAAIEMAMMYAELNNVLSESFVETASREYLLIKCKEQGIDITKFEASHGIHLGVFNVEVSNDSRWNCDLYNYRVIEKVGESDGLYQYRLECETPGTAPNTIVGDLTPISEYYNSLTVAYIDHCLLEGENENTDNEIREAYKNHVDGGNIDGNVKQYQQWCDDFDGLGSCKIFPLWNGDNTVKVSILTTSNEIASQDLIDEFQEYLDPGVTGMGNGVAPIGAFVTVTTATGVPINVNCDITFKEGYTNTDAISDSVEAYLKQIAYQKSQISYFNLGAVIIGTEGVESINNLTLNGGTSDINLGDEEIPVLGTVNWTVV